MRDAIILLLSMYTYIKLSVCPANKSHFQMRCRVEIWHTVKYFCNKGKNTKVSKTLFLPPQILPRRVLTDWCHRDQNFMEGRIDNFLHNKTVYVKWAIVHH